LFFGCQKCEIIKIIQDEIIEKIERERDRDFAKVSERWSCTA
jgi:hypothetical protein